MAKSPTAAIQKMNKQVPGKDGAVKAPSTPKPAPAPIFTAGEVVMVPIHRDSLEKLGKSDAEAVNELSAALTAYCDRGSATADPHAITVSNDQRKEMIRLFGSDFKTGDDIVRAIRKLVSINLDFLEIGEVDLPINLLARLKTRCHNQDKEPSVALAARKEVGKRAVIEGLEIFTHLR